MQNQDPRLREKELLGRCQGLLHTEAGRAFLALFRAREERRREEAATASLDTFPGKKGALFELRNLIKALESETVSNT